MSGARRATHANSWYSGARARLNGQLTQWLAAVSGGGEEVGEEPFSPPVHGCKAIIAPHAGYDYSGPTAAWAYKAIDVTGITRVFILGPSHHVYLNGCSLTGFQTYSTPLGDLPVCLDTVKELQSTGMFGTMSSRTDEKEHSIELHLPYIRKTFEGLDIRVVPILVGAIDEQKEAAYGETLAPYLAAENTIFVVSSDFCHWGERFDYTFYYPQPMAQSGAGSHVYLQRNTLKPDGQPIYASISDLDHEAIALLSEPGARTALSSFAAYLRRTANTICGRHPIGVLLGALAALESEDNGKAAKLRFVKYAQSSACETVDDSSVSYVSAYVTLN